MKTLLRAPPRMKLAKNLFFFAISAILRGMCQFFWFKRSFLASEKIYGFSWKGKNHGQSLWNNVGNKIDGEHLLSSFSHDSFSTADLWQQNRELCGTDPRYPNGKIVGGNNVNDIRVWPWIGFMIDLYSYSSCTVELISWGWATTSARCV